MDPTVCIVTVVRNNREGFERTYESVASQTYTDWRMVVKDGNSTDGTAELVKRVADADSRVSVATGPDTGIYDAMNIALDVVVEDYVLFLNAGDTLYRNHSLAQAIAVVARSRPDLALFNTAMVFPDGHTLLRRAKPISYISYGLPAIHQSILFRTVSHKRVPYDPTYTIVADYVAVARLLNLGADVVRCDTTLSSFELAEDSKSYREQSLSRHEMRRALREVMRFGGLRIAVSDVRRRVVNATKTLLMQLRAVR